MRRPPIDDLAHRRVLGEMARFGNNVNQTTHRLNADGYRAPPPELGQAMGYYYKQVRNAIFSALGMTPAASKPPAPPPQPEGGKRGYQKRKRRGVHD